MKIALIISIITLASRLLSLISVQVYMTFFGPRASAIEAYTFALTVPNIVFNLFGTSITAIVVPIYASLLKSDEKEADIFIKRMFAIIIAIVSFLMLIGFFLAPLVISITSLYYTQFAIFALRVMLISMLFYGINYLFQGILHSHNKFLLAAMVTVPSSLFIIGYTLILGDTFGVHGLVYATVAGLSLQGLILAPKAFKLLYKKGVRTKINIKNIKENEHMKKAITMLGPLLISASSFQIMSLFNTTVATHFTIAAIQGHVMNLVLVASLTIIYSITSVYLPKLSVQWEEDKERYKKTLNQIIILVLMLMIPASVALFMLRNEIISLLMEWGNFSAEYAALTATLLGIFGLAVVPVGLKEVADRAYYSQKNSKIPSIFGFIIMTTSVLFTIFMRDTLGAYTVAVAYVTSFTVGSIGLLKSLKLFNVSFFINLAKIMFSAGLMGIVLHIVPTLYFETGIIFINRFLMLAVPGILGVLTYLLMIYIFYRKKKSEFIMRGD